MAVASAYMTTIQDAGRRVLIVGLGATGLSCARFLAAHGAEIAVTDTRVHPPGLDDLRETLPDVAVFLGGLDEQALRSAHEIVVSPGVSLRTPVIAAAIGRGTPVIGDVELFARYARAPVAAITGSNGKSTVTTLLGEMARAAGRDVRVGGNLGTPALDLLSDGEPDLYVLELSSFQLETTASLSPAVAAVLNLSPDHMDRYQNVAEYAAAKARIYRRASMQIVNADDPQVVAMHDPRRAARRYTLQAPGTGEFGLVQDGSEVWMACGTERLLPAAELRIAGRHNLANALAAIAMGDALGLSREAMRAALAGFNGLPHRTQWVAERAGVTWYNDSKGTNVGATMAALNGFDAPVVLIAGGDGKGADFTPLRAVVAARARAVVLIGRDAPRIEAALADSVPVFAARDLDEAVRTAAAQARAGDVVLLSPACASFDMFRNYEDRGERFTTVVRRFLE
ncbi:MAG TPA: UDP-N-acetylmuramoyl-L-alanine--D-glutamate ligase [Gammaproteobacteria bacterium]|nr:UDP-N-acetylmuramoyl-L-alanine--D-glutamate ligase [Gammaproteobacteria bacterium]